MAANNNPNDSEEGKEACKLMELFKGRFSEEEAEGLLAEKGSLDAAADFVMNGNPAEVRRMIHDRNNALVPALQRSCAEVAVALNRGIAPSIRLFGCGDCDFYWWRLVPARKEVSKCRRCQTKLDPVPRDQEWGLAEFECDCGNVFKGTGWMNHTQGPCFECQSKAMPARIIPPTKDREETRRSNPRNSRGGFHRNRAQGAEAAEYGRRDTYNYAPSVSTAMTATGPLTSKSSLTVNYTAGSYASYEQTQQSVSLARRRKVLYPSPRHLSTGSTVRTFMTQGDLAEDYQDLESMPSIIEYFED